MIHPSSSHPFGFMASLDFRSWSVEAVSACLAELGYSSVEWTLSHFNPDQGYDTLVNLARIPERHGLFPSEIVVQQDLVVLDPQIHQQRVDLIAASIPMAARIGIPILNLFTGPAPWDASAPRLSIDITEGQAWKLVLDAFDLLLPIAEKHHVYLAIEAVFGHLCHDYYTLHELLDHYDSEYLAVNLDPSHFELYRNDVPWVVHRLGPRIRHVHLKDVVGRPGLPGQDFSFPMLGEGVIDWPAFLTALDESGYRGALSVEFKSFNYYERVLKKDPRRAAELSMEQIHHLFENS